MKNMTAVTAFVLLLFTACKQEGPKTILTTSGTPEALTKEFEALTGPDIRCFAEKTPSNLEKGQFNYHLIRIEKKGGNDIAGVEYHFPYGTDSFRGSLKGILQPADQRITGELRGYAEGEHYTQQRSYQMQDNQLVLDYRTPQGEMASLPEVTCEEFDALLLEYRRGIFSNLINTTDRTRLKKLDGLKAYGFTEKDLDSIRFMERATDLDRDPTTTEYLLYLMDPSLCGSGGCNLLVVDSNNTIVADITVTKLPVYTELEDYESTMTNKGQWKTLFVYSKGMRRLTPINGKYPENPSVEEEVLMEQFSSFPESYVLLLDHFQGR